MKREWKKKTRKKKQKKNTNNNNVNSKSQVFSASFLPNGSIMMNNNTTGEGGKGEKKDPNAGLCTFHNLFLFITSRCRCKEHWDYLRNNAGDLRLEFCVYCAGGEDSSMNRSEFAAFIKLSSVAPVVLSMAATHPEHRHHVSGNFASTGVTAASTEAAASSSSASPSSSSDTTQTQKPTITQQLSVVVGGVDHPQLLDPLQSDDLTILERLPNIIQKHPEHALRQTLLSKIFDDQRNKQHQKFCVKLREGVVADDRQQKERAEAVSNLHRIANVNKISTTSASNAAGASAANVLMMNNPMSGV